MSLRSSRFQAAAYPSASGDPIRGGEAALVMIEHKANSSPFARPPCPITDAGKTLLVPSADRPQGHSDEPCGCYRSDDNPGIGRRRGLISHKIKIDDGNHKKLHK